MGPKEKTKKPKKGRNEKIGTHRPKHRHDLCRYTHQENTITTIKQSSKKNNQTPARTINWNCNGKNQSIKQSGEKTINQAKITDIETSSGTHPRLQQTHRQQITLTTLTTSTNNQSRKAPKTV
ncbi:hypothetical protein AVEN_144583-1 [Araneus ventricosus]|uniref:Uncharacterized protein n=1 Tax=Araneus ventricosus TaxID=182803 RepID=A0A4Y2C192_ARAVE|nr:hypothetical protein AVEN_144583-1 [Araneus ventricosus]